MCKRTWLVFGFCLALVTSPANAANGLLEKPVYQGGVAETAEPVVMRYRPFPRSYFEKIEEKSIELNGETKSVSAKQIGYVEGDTDWGDFVLTFFLSRIEGTDGGPERQKLLNMKISAVLSSAGTFKDFKINGKSLSEQVQNSQQKQFLQGMKGAFQMYPASGLETGDEFYTGQMRTQSQRIGVDPSGTVLGVTEYNGRRALVVDFTASFDFLEVMSGTSEGYMLCDIETGVVIYSDAVLQFKGKGGVSFSGRETTRVELAM